MRRFWMVLALLLPGLGYAADAVTDAAASVTDWSGEKIAKLEFSSDDEYAIWGKYDSGEGAFEVIAGKWDGSTEYDELYNLSEADCNEDVAGTQACGVLQDFAGGPQNGECDATASTTDACEHTYFVVWVNDSDQLIVCGFDDTGSSCKFPTDPCSAEVRATYEFPFPIKNQSQATRYMIFARTFTFQSRDYRQIVGFDIDDKNCPVNLSDPGVIYTEVDPDDAGLAVYLAWWRWDEGTNDLYFGVRDKPLVPRCTITDCSANLAVASFDDGVPSEYEMLIDPGDSDVIDHYTFNVATVQYAVFGLDYDSGDAAVWKKNNENAYAESQTFGYDATNVETVIADGSDTGAQSFEPFLWGTDYYAAYYVMDSDTKIVQGDCTAPTYDDPSCASPLGTGGANYWTEIWVVKLTGAGAGSYCMISTPDSGTRYGHFEPEVTMITGSPQIFYHSGQPVNLNPFAHDLDMRRIVPGVKATFDTQCAAGNVLGF